MSVLPSKQQKLLRYVLKDILDCPVDSCFIVCIAVDEGDLEQGTYYAEKAKIVASDLSRIRCQVVENVWQEIHDHSGED